MGGDRLRPSLFERIPDGDEKNVPLLLDFIYGEIMHKVNVLETQVKGRLSAHETDLIRADDRLKRQENCPCAVLRDPAHTCVIMDVRDELGNIRAEQAAELATMRTEQAAQLSAITNRLSKWGGGLAVVIVLLEIAVRLLPLIWR